MRQEYNRNQPTTTEAPTTSKSQYTKGKNKTIWVKVHSGKVTFKHKAFAFLLLRNKYRINFEVAGQTVKATISQINPKDSIAIYSKNTSLIRGYN